MFSITYFEFDQEFWMFRERLTTRRLEKRMKSLQERLLNPGLYLVEFLFCSLFTEWKTNVLQFWIEIFVRNEGIQNAVALDLHDYDSKSAIRLLKFHIRSLASIACEWPLFLCYCVPCVDLYKIFKWHGYLLLISSST